MDRNRYLKIIEEDEPLVYPKQEEEWEALGKYIAKYFPDVNAKIISDAVNKATEPIASFFPTRDKLESLAIRREAREFLLSFVK